MMCPARGSAPSCRYDPGPPDFSQVPFPTHRRLAAFSPHSGMNLVQKAGAGGVVVNSRDIAEHQPPRQPWTSTQRDWKRFASSPPRSRGIWAALYAAVPARSACSRSTTPRGGAGPRALPVACMPPPRVGVGVSFIFAQRVVYYLGDAKGTCDGLVHAASPPRGSWDR